MKRITRLSLWALAFGSSAIGLLANEVNVYSHRHYEADKELFATFEKKTGIKVNVLLAKADQLIERIKAEGEKTNADILITADAGRLERAKEANLLEPVESDILQNQVPTSFRDGDNTWFGFTVRARVLVYAKDRVKSEELSTYEDLADPKWKGRLLCRSSSNIYNQSLLASLIANNGKADALKWAQAVRKNMAHDPRGSDRDQVRDVAAGVADIAIVNTYYLGLLANSPDEKDRDVASKVSVFFPNQGEDQRGTHVNVSGGGVVKHAKNKENAIKLLEFLVSEEAQKAFSSSVYEYPLSMKVDYSELLSSWGTFQADSLPLNKLGEESSEAVKLFALAGWK